MKQSAFSSRTFPTLGKGRTIIRVLIVHGVAVTLALTVIAQARAGEAYSVAALVRASGDALGVAALSRLHDVRLSGAADVSGIKGTASLWQDLHRGTFATSIAAGPLSGDNGYDGQISWSRDPFGVVWNDGSRDAYYMSLATSYVGSYGLWKPDYGGARVTLGKSQTVAGKRYDFLSVTPRGGLPFDYWIDAQTHLPFRTVAPIGITTTTTTYSGYRPFSGLQIAVEQKQETVQGAVSVKVESVRFDDPDTATHLERPTPTVADFSIANGTATSVPFELVDNHVYLDVSVNGKGPYRFVLDTGGALILDSALAKSLRLRPAGSIQGQGVGAGTDTFHFAQIDSLAIGAAKIGRLNAAVVSVRSGFGISGGKPIDGLIGFETLARFVTTFDYGAETLTLRMPGAPLPPGGTTVAFTFNGTDPMLPCRIGGVAGSCSIDTGSRSALSLLGPFARANPKLVSGLTATGVDGFGVGGPALGRLGRTTLAFAGYTLPNVIADVSSQESGAFANPFVAGNIGGAVWRRFAVTFDYGHETMTLLPNVNYAAAEQYDRSGLFVIARDGKIVVADARPGTPAATAGIARGDMLDSIDGTAANTLTLKDIRERFMQPAGTAHALIIAAKDGTRRTVALTLRDYV